MAWLLLEVSIEVFYGLPLGKDLCLVIKLATFNKLGVSAFHPRVPTASVLARASSSLGHLTSCIALHGTVLQVLDHVYISWCLMIKRVRSRMIIKLKVVTLYLLDLKVLRVDPCWIHAVCSFSDDHLFDLLRRLHHGLLKLGSNLCPIVVLEVVLLIYDWRLDL